MTLRVTSGVPSLSSAMTRLARVGSGCATTCDRTTTSSGIDSPKNGEVSAKAATDLGSPQLIAPPTDRPPDRSRTGINGCSSTRLTSLAATRGPANRSSMPPVSIHASNASVSRSDKVATSAKTITSGLAGNTSLSAPSIRSAVGSSACFKKWSGDNNSSPSRPSRAETKATSRRRKPSSTSVVAPADRVP